MGMKWYLFVVFIYISFMTNDVKHLFTFFLAICIFPGEMSLQILYSFKN